jgi:hypothetical protein
MPTGADKKTKEEVEKDIKTSKDEPQTLTSIVPLIIPASTVEKLVTLHVTVPTKDKDKSISSIWMETQCTNKPHLPRTA